LGINNEEVLMEITVSHQHLILNYGGQLVLTKKSLIFKPNSLNRAVGAKEVIMNLKDIDDISKTRIIGPHANQIWVKSKGQRFRFVVAVWENKDKLIDAVKKTDFINKRVIFRLSSSKVRISQNHN